MKRNMALAAIVLLLLIASAPLVSQADCDAAVWLSASQRLEDFYDVAEVASFTSRISLPFVLIELHRARRAFVREDFPECWWDVVSQVSSGMYNLILGYELFVAEDPDAEAFVGSANRTLAEAAEQLRAMGVAPDYRMMLFDTSTPTPTPRPRPSATARPPTPTPTSTHVGKPVATTEGATSAFGLAVTQTVQVVALDGVELRAEPSIWSEIVQSLLPFSYIVLIDGPVERDGNIWWQAQTTSNAIGWVAEGDSGAQHLSNVPG